jgi:DMSO/TMAO reductase YedYZ molybdopterin-dependent catalytic subunit
VTRDFPVLSAGPTPHTPLEEWSFTIDGSVEGSRSWTLEEFRALPSETVTVDIHCVTKWSKLDTTWTGVAIDTLLEAVPSDAGYVTAWCDGGYTTNLPLEDLTDGKAWIAYEYGGEPLDPEHGGPARGCWCRTSISGRARSGCEDSSCAMTTSPDSGSATATTTTATPGKSSVTGGIDEPAS